MKILHYTLGLPPYRSGGLTKYSCDLMIEQANKGEVVYLLYPGHFNLCNKTKIKYNKMYKGIYVYEMINPLPVPLLNGIKDVEKFIESKDIEVFKGFINKISPDVIHIHTLMGLPIEFLEAAKDIGIKIIFTTHDYFGICPKVNLITDKGQICNDYCNGAKCVVCNKKAYSIGKIYLMQSRIYKILKNINSLKNFALKLKRQRTLNVNQNIENIGYVETYEITDFSYQYVKLRNYYLNILQKVDYFHFNSSVAKSEYEKYVKCKGEIINITHKDIKDNRQEKSFSNEKQLRIGYLGPTEKYKGFNLLTNALKALNKEGIENFRLDVYGNKYKLNVDVNNTFFHGKYNYSELRNIFNNIDVLIAPSICKETYGFIVLEAMSYGIPVIVTNCVGAKDLIEDNISGFIVESNENSIKEIIISLMDSKQLLQDVARNLLSIELPLDFGEHVGRVIELYKGGLY
ncbi:glycosyltransferase [Clostridium prolinivorans]|uniref:glycosyltransferase n=1 Tax=Clostridium prolinivorans TaxID=2769420 RepID=UPI000FDB680A|nr:glycosyltransferase [Clostridium prolinivorans]